MTTEELDEYLITQRNIERARLAGVEAPRMLVPASTAIEALDEVAAARDAKLLVDWVRGADTRSLALNTEDETELLLVDDAETSHTVTIEAGALVVGTVLRAAIIADV